MGRAPTFDPVKQGKRCYLLLFQRSHKPVDERFKQIMTETFLFEELEKAGAKLTIEDDYYLMGDQYWAQIMSTDTQEDLIKFLRIWREYYGEYYSKVTQYEILYVVRRNNILNPDLKGIAGMLR